MKMGEGVREETIPLVDLSAGEAEVGEAIREVVAEVLGSHHYINGPAVGRFEQQMSAYCGVGHAIGVSSGTDALLAALMALGIGPGDEVITTPLTFFATAGAIARLGATPRFVDVEEESFGLDPAKVEGAITPRTRALLPVHLFGQMCDMEALTEVARTHGLWVVEDAAQAIGARRAGRMPGQGSAAATLSFFPTKNLGAAGDAGMVLCEEDALAQEVRVVCRHGAEPKYVHGRIGGNFRLDTIQAAILEVKLAHLPKWTQQRQENAAFYDAAFRKCDERLRVPRVALDSTHVYHHYCVRLRERDRVQRALEARGVGTAVYYPKPLHVQACFAELGYEEGELPVSERLCEELLALPVWPGMSPAQLEGVASAVLEAL